MTPEDKKLADKVMREDAPILRALEEYDRTGHFKMKTTMKD